MSKAFGPSRWPPRFLAAAAWIIGARVRVEGEPVRPHTLLIANHTSWLDILVLAAATRCTFVSKDQLGHGFIHWLADQNSTVYVRRSHRKGAKDQALAIARALEREQPVALFPEGTTGPGDQLLPFRSTLLESAVFASKDVEVRPVAIDYGAAATEVGWFNEPAKDNALRILGRKGTSAGHRAPAPAARPRRRPQADGGGGPRSDRRALVRFKFRAGWPIATSDDP